MTRIRSISSASPPYSLSQHDAAEIAARLMRADSRRASALKRFYGASGVDVHWTSIDESQTDTALYAPGTKEAPFGPTTAKRLDAYNRLAPPLAIRSSLDALERAHIQAKQITHLVTASCTGFSAPGVDVALVESLGMDPTVARTHVGFMGCHAAINALRVADAQINMKSDAIALVCCVELCSLHFQYAPRNGGATANAIFSDGAASCVLAHQGEGPQLAGFGSHLWPDTTDSMGWRIGDHGFEMTLSPRVPKILESSVRDWIASWLQCSEMKIDEIEQWIIHPGGPRIVESVLRSLMLEPNRAHEARELATCVLRDYGNMSSPTVLKMLESKLHHGPLDGPTVVLAFGPGLTGEALLLMP